MEVNPVQATLEEVVEADLLLHVIDASSPNVAVQRQAVYSILKQLGIKDPGLKDRVLEVWNKSDLVTPADRISSPSSNESLSHAPESGNAAARLEYGELEIDAGQNEAATRGQESVDDGRGSNRLSMPSDNLDPQEHCNGNQASIPNREEEEAASLSRESSEVLDKASTETAQQDAVWQLIQVIVPQQN